MDFDGFIDELRELEELHQEIARYGRANATINTEPTIRLLDDLKLKLRRIQARWNEFIVAYEALERSVTQPILADREILGIGNPDDIENVHTDDLGNITDDQNVQEEHDFRKCFLIGMILASVLLSIFEF